MTYPTNILKRYQVLANPEETLNLNIRTIISSYNSPWDPLTELIQNAVDAINQRKAIENGAFKGEILITVDPLENILMIEDNGIGMDPGNAETLLLPSGTFKKSGNTYGHKGLGFTYCSHIVDYVEVDTEQFQSHAKDHWIFENGFNWVNDISKTTELKSLTNSSIRQFTEHGGTCVKMKFAIGTYDRNIGNTASLDNFFNWASEPNILSFVLRTRTAIGQVHNLFGKQPPVDIIISVAFKHINKTITVPYSYFDFYNYAPFNQQTDSLASDYATNIYLNPVVPNKIHHGIYTVFQHDAQNPTTPLKVGSMRGGVQFSGYLYCCGKDNFSQALEQYDNRLGIDGEFNYLAISPEVHLAIDGMPNGVPIDNWKYQGAFEQRYFAIVNCELKFGTILDAGRKTITPHYVGLLVNKLLEMSKDQTYFNGQVSFYQMSHQLNNRKGRRPPGGRSPVQYINQWKTKLPQINNSFIFNQLGNDELACYVLFGELIGRGIIPGYTLLYVSGGGIYDAAAEFQVDFSNPRHLNQSANGQQKFGVGQGLMQLEKYNPSFPSYKWQNHSTGQTHLIMEFKVTVEELLKELQSNKSEKQSEEIDILVCMDLGRQQVLNLNGAITDVNDASRFFSGVTHELHYGGRTINIICLSEILNQL